jgi:hypothetical protein
MVLKDFSKSARYQLGRNERTLHQQVPNKQNTDGGLEHPVLASYQNHETSSFT